MPQFKPKFQHEDLINYYDINDAHCGTFTYSIGNPDVAVFTISQLSTDLSTAAQIDVYYDTDVTKVADTAPYNRFYQFNLSVTLDSYGVTYDYASALETTRQD